MKKRNTIQIGSIQLDDEEKQLQQQMSVLEKNLHKIQEEYMAKINKLKQMNKAQNQKSLKLTKQILQLKKINEVQKEEVQKIMHMAKDQSKVSTPRTIKKMASKQVKPRSPAGSPNTKAFGASQRVKKTNEMFRKSTDFETSNKIRKSVELKKLSPKISPYKSISINDKNQDSAKTTKASHKIMSQKHFRQSVHVFK